MKLNKVFTVAALLASSVANAASVEGVQGDVRVSQGKGFAAIQDSAELLPGDKIRVGRKGAAQLVYPDKCSVPLSPDSLTTVAKHSPCSFVAQVPDGGSGDYAPWLIGAGFAGIAAGTAVAASHQSSGGQFPLLFLPLSP